MQLYTLAVILHVIGAVVGAGTVLINDLQLMRAIGDKDLGVAYQKSAGFLSKLIMAGLVLLIVSGIYFMISKPFFWQSEKIVTKLAIVAVLLVNGVMMNLLVHPKLNRIKPTDWTEKSQALKKLINFGLPFGVISIVSWFAALFLGAAGRQSWNAPIILAVYALTLVIVYVVTRYIINKRFVA